MSRDVTSIMPRMGAAIVLIAIAAGCRFDADYRGGTFRCRDGVCPSGLTCVREACVGPLDAAAIDASAVFDASTMIDARPPLTCGQPGELARGNPVTRAGSTIGGVNHVGAMCGALVMNGPDAVYRVTASQGDHLDVTVTGDSLIKAYVLTTCPSPPAAPACEGAAFTQAGAAALTLSGLAAGPHFILVDDENPAQGGAYELTVHLRP
jgi:hypothetical protein